MLGVIPFSISCEIYTLIVKYYGIIAISMILSFSQVIRYIS